MDNPVLEKRSMRRTRTQSRGTSPVSPRRVGRPPKSEASVLSYGRSYYEGLRIPSGVIRSNFGRRGGGGSYGGRPFRSVGSNRGIVRSRGRGRPPNGQSPMKNSQASGSEDRSFGDTNATDDGGSGDEQPSTSALPNSSFNAMNGNTAKITNNVKSPQSLQKSIVVGRRENINLLTLIAGGVAGPGSTRTVKDLVCMENFRKLPVYYQQHLLKMLPKKDVTVSADDTLQPTFSAMKNEYLSAALLDLNERLLSGEASSMGIILAVPLSSPVASRRPSDQPLARPDSACAVPPPLPRIRINLASKVITFIPRGGSTESGASSSAVSVTTRRTVNGADSGSGNSGSMNGAKSCIPNGPSVTEVDLTPIFAKQATINSLDSFRPDHSDNSRSPSPMFTISKKHENAF